MLSVEPIVVSILSLGESAPLHRNYDVRIVRQYKSQINGYTPVDNSLILNNQVRSPRSPKEWRHRAARRKR
jgi:hypothetical protein